MLNNINVETAKKMIKTLQGVHDKSSFEYGEVDYNFSNIYWVNGAEFLKELINNGYWEKFAEEFYYLDKMDMIFLFIDDYNNVAQLKTYIELATAKVIKYEVLVKNDNKYGNGIIKEAFYIPSAELIIVDKSYYISRTEEEKSILAAVGHSVGENRPENIKLINKMPMKCVSEIF